MHAAWGTNRPLNTICAVQLHTYIYAKKTCIILGICDWNINDKRNGTINISMSILEKWLMTIKWCRTDGSSTKTRESTGFERPIIDNSVPPYLEAKWRTFYLFPEMWIITWNSRPTIIRNPDKGCSSQYWWVFLRYWKFRLIYMGRYCSEPSLRVINPSVSMEAIYKCFSIRKPSLHCWKSPEMRTKYNWMGSHPPQWCNATELCHLD